MGVLEGPVMPIGQMALAKESTPHRRGFNIGFAQSGVGLIGATITPLFVTQIATAFNWHISFYVVAVPGLIMSLILLKFMKEPFAKRVGSEDKVVSHRVRLSDLKLILHYRNTWLAAVITALFMAWLFVFTAFAPEYLINGDHFTPNQMGLIMSAIGMGSFLWGFIVPWISDKLGRKLTIIIFSFVSAFLQRHWHYFIRDCLP